MLRCSEGPELQLNVIYFENKVKMLVDVKNVTIPTGVTQLRSLNPLFTSNFCTFKITLKPNSKQHLLFSKDAFDQS